MCSPNVDTYKTPTGISDKIQRFPDEHCGLLQADWLLNVCLPTQACNYCHRWRRSSITWYCTLITLDILLLSVKNYLRVCKFLHYANDSCEGISDRRPNNLSIRAIFRTKPTYVMILLRLDNKLYFYVNNSVILTERMLLWQGFPHHANIQFENVPTLCYHKGALWNHQLRHRWHMNEHSLGFLSRISAFDFDIWF